MTAKPRIYRIVWSNEHATGTLSYRFTNRREAERAASAWKREMVVIDDNPREARRAYSWEIATDETEEDR